MKQYTDSQLSIVKAISAVKLAGSEMVREYERVIGEYWTNRHRTDDTAFMLNHMAKHTPVLAEAARKYAVKHMPVAVKLVDDVWVVANDKEATKKQKLKRKDAFRIFVAQANDSLLVYKAKSAKSKKVEDKASKAKALEDKLVKLLGDGFSDGELRTILAKANLRSKPNVAAAA